MLQLHSSIDDQLLHIPSIFFFSSLYYNCPKYSFARRLNSSSDVLAPSELALNFAPPPSSPADDDSAAAVAAAAAAPGSGGTPRFGGGGGVLFGARLAAITGRVNSDVDRICGTGVRGAEERMKSVGP